MMNSRKASGKSHNLYDSTAQSRLQSAVVPEIRIRPATSWESLQKRRYIDLTNPDTPITNKSYALQSSARKTHRKQNTLTTCTRPATSGASHRGINLSLQYLRTKSNPPESIETYTNICTEIDLNNPAQLMTPNAIVEKIVKPGNNLTLKHKIKLLDRICSAQQKVNYYQINDSSQLTINAYNKAKHERHEGSQSNRQKDYSKVSKTPENFSRFHQRAKRPSVFASSQGYINSGFATPIHDLPQLDLNTDSLRVVPRQESVPNTSGLPSEDRTPKEEVNQLHDKHPPSLKSRLKVIRPILRLATSVAPLGFMSSGALQPNPKIVQEKGKKQETLATPFTSMINDDHIQAASAIWATRRYKREALKAEKIIEERMIRRNELLRLNESKGSASNKYEMALNSTKMKARSVLAQKLMSLNKKKQELRSMSINRSAQAILGKQIGEYLHNLQERRPNSSPDPQDSTSNSSKIRLKTLASEDHLQSPPAPLTSQISSILSSDNKFPLEIQILLKSARKSLHEINFLKKDGKIDKIMEIGGKKSRKENFLPRSRLSRTNRFFGREDDGCGGCDEDRLQESFDSATSGTFVEMNRVFRILNSLKKIQEVLDHGNHGISVKFKQNLISGYLNSQNPPPKAGRETMEKFTLRETIAYIINEYSNSIQERFQRKIDKER